MARYWRITGILAGATLELSEAVLYEGGVLVSVAPTCTLAPTSGAVADLADGLATGVVAWANYKQPGFALVWDTAGVILPALRLGAGNSADTFPLDLTMQSSEDGANWITFRAVKGVTYPGALALTLVQAAPVVDADPYSANVSLALNGLIDLSPTPKTLVVTCDVYSSSLGSKFGGNALFMDGNTDFVTIPDASDLDFGTGDFTVEAYVLLRVMPTSDAWPGAWYNHMVVLSKGVPSGSPGYGLVIGANYIGWNNHDAFTVTGLHGITQNTWHHVAVTRASGLMRSFVGGVLVGSQIVTTSFSYPGYNAHIGAETGEGAWFNGGIEQLRVKKGEALYTTGFTPAQWLGSVPLLPLASSSQPRLRSTAPIADLCPGSVLPPTAARGHLREHTFADAYHGGQGSIVGTVKEKGASANTPIHRKVWLIDERSQMVIRETWSDPITGVFEFSGVSKALKYTTVSFDHLHNYRAVIADNQDAT